MVKRKVAIFDVDGTIFRSSLLIELVEQLIRDGLFPEDAQAMYSQQKEKWEKYFEKKEDLIQISKLIDSGMILF